ncbi:hypothetical protein CDAR_43981 [Caerostris darwini]|uniref:Uncharacterized protein n=1 Tax=Caerostris darwini TaxID=1538125 RepID=A0AAV4WGW6_9ARAC|nr:hypothetical protein CDAR_43981 [Caerostris darwini]
MLKDHNQNSSTKVVNARLFLAKMLAFNSPVMKMTLLRRNVDWRAYLRNQDHVVWVLLFLRFSFLSLRLILLVRGYLGHFAIVFYRLCRDRHGVIKLLKVKHTARTYSDDFRGSNLQIGGHTSGGSSTDPQGDSESDANSIAHWKSNNETIPSGPNHSPLDLARASDPSLTKIVPTIPGMIWIIPLPDYSSITMVTETESRTAKCHQEHVTYCDGCVSPPYLMIKGLFSVE